MHPPQLLVGQILMVVAFVIGPARQPKTESRDHCQNKDSHWCTPCSCESRLEDEGGQFRPPENCCKGQAMTNHLTVFTRPYSRMEPSAPRAQPFGGAIRLSNQGGPRLVFRARTSGSSGASHRLRSDPLVHSPGGLARPVPPLADQVQRRRNGAMHSLGCECMAGLGPLSLGVGAPSESVFTASAGSSRDPAAVHA